MRTIPPELLTLGLLAAATQEQGWASPRRSGPPTSDLTAKARTARKARNKQARRARRRNRR